MTAPVTALSNSPSVTASDSKPTGLLLVQSASQEQPANDDVVLASKTQPLNSVSDKPTLKCELETFSSTFLTIFLAELGDKTQLTTLLMSAQSQSPWVVFAGAGTALVLTSLLGILLGRWLATKVTPKTLEASSGVLLLVIAAMLFWDILRS